MTVDGQDSGITVIRTVSKGRQRNKENVHPELSRATASAEPPVQRHKLQDLTNRISKVTQMSPLDEVQEEDVTAEQDDQMPQLFSQASGFNHE